MAGDVLPTDLNTLIFPLYFLIEIISILQNPFYLLLPFIQVFLGFWVSLTVSAAVVGLNTGKRSNWELLSRGIWLSQEKDNKDIGMKLNSGEYSSIFCLANRFSWAKLSVRGWPKPFTQSFISSMREIFNVSLPLRIPNTLPLIWLTFVCSFCGKIFSALSSCCCLLFKRSIICGKTFFAIIKLWYCDRFFFCSLCHLYSLSLSYPPIGSSIYHSAGQATAISLALSIFISFGVE